MAIKTFNIDPEVHEKFAKHCKNSGLSMSRLIETFMRHQLAESDAERRQHAETLGRAAKAPSAPKHFDTV